MIRPPAWEDLERPPAAPALLRVVYFIPAPSVTAVAVRLITLW